MGSFKNKINNPLLLIIFVVMLTIYFVLLIIKYPLVGLEVEEKDNQWVIENIYENGWAATQQIDEGSIVQFINGKDPGQHQTVIKYNRVEKAESITLIDSSDELNEHSIKYSMLDRQLLLHLIMPLTFNILTLLLSVFLYYRTNGNRSSKILIYFLLSIGICYLSATGSARGDAIGRVVNIITLHSSSLLFILFLNSYLKRYGLVFLKPFSLVKLYVFNFILLIIIALVFVFNNLYFVYNIFELIFFASIICSLIIYLMYFFVINRNLEARNFLRILWTTLVIAFGPFILMYAIPKVLLNEEWVSAEISSAFLIVLPITFVYLQLAEKLFDIDFLLDRLRYYLMLSFPFSIILSLLLSLISTNLPFFIHLVIFSIILICTTLFLYLKEFMDFKMRHHLFSAKGNFDNSIYHFLLRAKQETKEDGLVKQLINEIKSQLKLKQIENIEVSIDGENKFELSLKRDTLDHRFVEAFEMINWNIYNVGAIVEVMNGYCIIFGQEINKRHIIYFRLVDSNTKLNIRERAWLETLSYYSSILLENIQVIEKLFNKIKSYEVGTVMKKDNYPNWLSRLLFSLSEKERMNLSIDLHDSVLQDQLQLLRKIEELYNQVRNTPLEKDLYQVKEGLLDNIHLTRETCNELRPPLLNELGIVPSLENLINQTSLRCNYILKAELDHSIQKLDKEHELVLYRVVQELLNNAVKHSFATEVSIILSKYGDIVALDYHDNGKGFDMKKLENSYSTIGIFGMKERVKSIGGAININSELSVGTVVSIKINTGGYTND